MKRQALPMLITVLALAACSHQNLDMATARAKALEAQPGRVVDEELEVEDGREIYSFEIDPEDGSGNLREVHIDPKTGAVLAIETETPADEAREKAEDREDEDDDDDDEKDDDDDKD
ncbi:MAG: PepSY domain-containing protein [Myxococcales bacterium]|nr:PepSY domain-containing protein [Myxococcales bacterium]